MSMSAKIGEPYWIAQMRVDVPARPLDGKKSRCPFIKHGTPCRRIDRQFRGAMQDARRKPDCSQNCPGGFDTEQSASRFIPQGDRHGHRRARQPCPGMQRYRSRLTRRGCACHVDAAQADQNPCAFRMRDQLYFRFFLENDAAITRELATIDELRRVTRRTHEQGDRMRRNTDAVKRCSVHRRMPNPQAIEPAHRRRHQQRARFELHRRPAAAPHGTLSRSVLDGSRRKRRVQAIAR